MGRSPCCDKDGLKKGPWTPEEDNKLIQYIQLHGPGNWRTLPKNAGLQRCGKSCRLRWTNYLRPDIKRGRFSFEEEETIIQLHSVLGNKWSAIAARLPGRTDNEIKNYWNTHIRKRLLRHGIDPVTHAPRLDLLDLSSLLNSPQLNISNLLRLQTLLNPEALMLAMSLVSPNNNNQNINPDLLSQDNQLLNSLLQVQNKVPDHHLQPNQFENIISQQIPSNLTTNSVQDQTHAYNPMPKDMEQFTNPSCHQGQVFQQNPTTSNQNDINYNVPSFKSLPSAIPNTTTCYGADFSENSSFQSYNSSCSNNSSHNFGFDSASTLINSTGEDEKESFCSNLLRFEIPESLDFDDFM